MIIFSRKTLPALVWHVFDGSDNIFLWMLSCPGRLNEITYRHDSDISSTGSQTIQQITSLGKRDIFDHMTHVLIVI